MLREIVLDTETTGLEPAEGHRIVEVAAVELIDHLPSGRHFQSYLDPERDVPEEARRVHGLTREFLQGYPTFAECAEELLSFLGDSRLVIHNAAFDLKFLNAELSRIGREPLPAARVVDTLAIAQRRFPGSPASLDALCRRFGVDASARTVHGALLDCQLLAEVYLHLLGGRQTDLGLRPASSSPLVTTTVATPTRPFRPPRPHAPSPDEEAAHAALLDKLADPIWRR